MQTDCLAEPLCLQRLEAAGVARDPTTRKPRARDSSLDSATNELLRDHGQGTELSSLPIS